MPDARNRNTSIETYFSRALARVVGGPITRSGVEAVIDAIAARKPKLAIGLGSVASDDVDYTAIYLACRSVGARLVYWLHDDPYEFDFNWKVVDRSDWIFTTDLASIPFYASSRVSHLPLAADRDFHVRHELLPTARRPFDAFFCGVAFPNRTKIIERLRGLLEKRRTEVLGDGWPPELSFCSNIRITQEQIREKYGQSKVVLNIGRQFNLANLRFEIVPSTPGPRTFEAAAAGCVQAVFLEGLEIFDYYKQGEEILHFSSVTDFARILERSQDAPDEMDAIARRARDRTVASHTYDHRAEQLISVLKYQGLLNQPAFV